MAALPAGGGGGTINVTPQDVQAAAKAFYTAQSDLENAWTKLQTALAVNAGMAGNDAPATSFNASYARAAEAAWNALRTSALTLGGVSAGLTQTANNFLMADHHSSARPSGPPALFTQEPVFDDIAMAGPSPAIGTGETVWFLPGPLARFWPNAHPGQVRAAAGAWHSTAGSIEVIAGHAGAALASLEGNDDTTTAIAGFWSQVYSPGNARTVLAGAQQICQSLGDACVRYADAIEAKRNDVRNALIGAGIAVGITTIVGVALTVFTGGGSDAAAGIADEAEVAAIVGDVAAETSATVASEVAATIGEDLVATVETATANAPAVETAEAEVTQVEGDVEGALDKALSEDPGLARLSDSEAATLTRLQEEYPGSDFKPSAEERDGEYVDNRGRTYDQMGNPNTSKYWNPSSAQKFYQAINSHLLKSMDFTVIDLTGFSEQSIADITSYVDSLPEVEQAKIIRIGF